MADTQAQTQAKQILALGEKLDSAKGDVKTALGKVVENRRGDAEEANKAYQDLHSSTARVYGELRAAVGVDVGYEDFETDSPQILAPSKKSLVGTSTRGTLSWLLMNSTKADMDGFFSGVSDPDERAIDKNIAKKLDEQRIALIKQLNSETHLANPMLIDQLKALNFTAIIKETDKEIEAVDEHYQERWQRSALIGWVNTSRHSEEVSAGLNPLKVLFDHPRFHAHVEIGSDGKISAQVTQIPLFSTKGKLFAAGQLLGAYYEALNEGVPEYETEIKEKKDKDGNTVYKKDENGKQVLDKDGNAIPETEEVRGKQKTRKDKDGNEIPVYRKRTPDEISNEPFPLGSVPSGFPDEGFTFLCNIVAIAGFQGRQVAGIGADGPTPQLLETLTNNMQPKVKAAFLHKVHSNWKQGLEAAQQRVQKHIVEPQLRKMFISELSQADKTRYGDRTLREKAGDYLKTSWLGKGINKGVGYIPVRDVRNYLTLEATGKTSVSEEKIQEKMAEFQQRQQAGGADAEQCRKTIELLVKGRFEDVMSGGNAPDESAALGNADAATASEAMEIITAKDPSAGSAISATGAAGEADKPGKSPDVILTGNEDQPENSDVQLRGTDADGPKSAKVKISGAELQKDIAAKVKVASGAKDNTASEKNEDNKPKHR